jgi:hypothetical protein
MSSLGSTWDQVEINFPVGARENKQTNMWQPIQLPNYMGCLMEFYTSFYTILYENEFQNFIFL